MSSGDPGAYCFECESEVATEELLGGRALVRHQKFTGNGFEVCPGSGAAAHTPRKESPDHVSQDP